MTMFAAMDFEGRTHYIGEVERGAACHCYCPVCKSPLVAKQGDVNTWHFAHEGDQERPECLPGSINLLRALAIEQLASIAVMPVPAGSQWVSVASGHRDLQELVHWTYPVAHLTACSPDAPKGHRVATLSFEGGMQAGLFVEIAGLDCALETNPEEGQLLYACPPPTEGSIRTRKDAVAYLANHATTVWRRMPGVREFTQGTRDRLLAKRDAMLADQKRSEEQRLAQHRQQPARYDPLHDALQNEKRRFTAAFNAQEEAAAILASLPPWARLKRAKTSFYAFKSRGDETFWVLLDSAEHDGYFIAPVPEGFDGWDEALPASLGTPDMARSMYVGQGSKEKAVAWFYANQSSASRVDSDARLIAQFVGYTPNPGQP